MSRKVECSFGSGPSFHQPKNKKNRKKEDRGTWVKRVPVQLLPSLVVVLAQVRVEFERPADHEKDQAEFHNENERPYGKTRGHTGT
jgi:hypothetical protein